MSDAPKKKPRRKLLQVAALTTGAIVGAGLATSGCSSTTSGTEDAAADTTDAFTVGRPAQDASTPDTPPPGIVVADAGTSVLDAGSE